MRTILKYNDYQLMKEEFIMEFKHGDVVNLKIVEEDGSEHLLKTNMIEVGCSVDRRNIYYKFRVLNKDDIKFPEESEMIFPIEFDGEIFGFIINIRSYNKPRTGHTMIEKHYRGKVDVVSIIKSV